MKIHFLEPLGIPTADLRAQAETVLGPDAELTFYEDRREDDETLLARSRGADCVVLSNLKYGSDIMEKLPELRYVCVAFTGVDLVDTAYCAEHGIRVSNCAGYSTAAVTDLVFGMLISLARNIPQCDAAVRASGTKAGLVGFELEGKRFGVIGAGAIGTRVLKTAQAFGCETLAFSRTVKDIPGVTFTDLDTLLRICDIVSVHVPLNASTRGMIGARELGLMKPNAILINAARGPIVDSAALADALNSGKLAGAAVDVFENEPPVAQDHPLLRAKNLLATPHVAFASDGAFRKRAAIVCDNLAAWQAGTAINVIV